MRNFDNIICSCLCHWLGFNSSVIINLTPPTAHAYRLLGVNFLQSRFIFFSFLSALCDFSLYFPENVFRHPGLQSHVMWPLPFSQLIPSPLCLLYCVSGTVSLCLLDMSFRLCWEPCISFLNWIFLLVMRFMPRSFLHSHHNPETLLQKYLLYT